LFVFFIYPVSIEDYKDAKKDDNSCNYIDHNHFSYVVKSLYLKLLNNTTFRLVKILTGSAMNVVIETERLLLRTFTEEDAALIYDLNLDPDVIRYTGDPIRDTGHALEVLQHTILPQYALYNHGRWAVHIKSGLEFIGWCGLKNRPERNEIDLGYRFLKNAWGKGYATESAHACIKYGFEKLGLRRIVGRAMPENIGSLRVLEKCGMTFIGDEVVDGHPAKTYEILNPSIP